MHVLTVCLLKHTEEGVDTTPLLLNHYSFDNRNVKSALERLWVDFSRCNLSNLIDKDVTSYVKSMLYYLSDNDYNTCVVGDYMIVYIIDELNRVYLSLVLLNYIVESLFFTRSRYNSLSFVSFESSSNCFR
jgi:hypothetical protein